MKAIIFIFFLIKSTFVFATVYSPQSVNYLLHNYISLTDILNNPNSQIFKQQGVVPTQEELKVLDDIRIRMLRLRTGTSLRSGNGSGVILGRTNTGALIVVTANHVLSNIENPSLFVTEGVNIEKNYGVLETEQKYLHQGPTDQFLPLVGPLVKDYQQTLPADDYALGVLYSSEHSQESNHELDLLKLNPNFMNSKWSEPVATSFDVPKTGDYVYFAGYPNALNNTGERSPETSFAKLGLGQIVSPEDSQTIYQASIEYKKTQNKPHIEINPQQTFYIYGNALPGFSGGGVFDKQGQLLGLTVRGGISKHPVTGEEIGYAVILKIEYILNELKKSIDAYPPQIKRKLGQVEVTQLVEKLIESSNSKAHTACRRLF